MVPSDQSLLQCVRSAIADMAPMLAEPEHKAVFNAIAIALNELSLRQDSAFYLSHYRQAVELIDAGAALGLGDGADLPKALGTTIGGAAIADHIGKATETLVTLVNSVSEREQGALKEYLNKITQWEIRLHQHRLTASPLPDGAGRHDKLNKEGLQSYLRDRFPDHPSLEVTGFSRLFGGFSKITILFSTSIPLFGCTDFVIRAEQASIINHPGGKTKNEYSVMRFAYEQGIRIPEPLWAELDESKLGPRFVVSRKSRGRNLGGTTGASDIAKTAVRELTQELARIHAIDIDIDNPYISDSHLLRWAKIPTLKENVEYKCEYWEQILRESPHSPSPLIQRGFNWIKNNIPQADDTAVLIHGDYGLHNILIDEDRVCAVLDWEVAHFGDRAQDLSWFINCMTGTASPEELLACYCEAGGKPVSAERLHFYDVYMSLNIVIVCNIALSRLDLASRNPSLAEIGLQMQPYFASKLGALIGS